MLDRGNRIGFACARPLILRVERFLDWLVWCAPLQVSGSLLFVEDSTSSTIATRMALDGNITGESKPSILNSHSLGVLLWFMP
jgi:hypothetical protein